MAQKNPPGKLAKFLAYVLGRRPDEFGLIPDADGYVKIKDLLKAMAEEEGWRYVRASHLNEVAIAVPNSPIELDDRRIRARDRSRLKPVRPAADLPVLLYTAVRTRAYPAILERGVSPVGFERIVLFDQKETAERFGRRFDPGPVVLTVRTADALAEGVSFDTAGESLYLADYIGPGCFSGPPPPREKPDAGKAEKTERKYRPDRAGTFVMAPKEQTGRRSRAGKGGRKKEVDWKTERRRRKKRQKKIDKPF